MDKKKQTSNNNPRVAAKGKPTGSSASSASSNATTPATFARGSSSSIPKDVLFWVDSSINPQDDDFQVTLTQLKSVMGIIHVFNDGDECMKFLGKTENDHVYMVASGSVGQQILPRIHNMRQLVAVFIYCIDRSKYESLVKTYSKVRGVFTDIAILCQSLQDTSRRREADAIDISLMAASDISGSNLDQLSQSFMYTKLIKEILLELKHDDDSVKELVTYCRDKYSKDEKELKNIETFRTGYALQSPIYWYTYESCIYKLLNWALRDQEFDVIVRMAFFICDLHKNIVKLHSEQIKSFAPQFIVHRGVNMPTEQFEKLKNTQGGLISFNNFLSTSTKKHVAMRFTGKNATNSELCGVLFIITIESNNSSTPFAGLDKVSCYGDEEKEILFSMQTIFRINDVKYDENDGVWHVHLKMTSDTDKQLNTLTERMRLEIQGPTALYRLGVLLIKLGEFIKAEEVFDTLAKRTSDPLQKAQIDYQLGYINDNLGHYDKALHFYQNALTVYTEHLAPDHQNIASCLNNIGLVYDNKKDHSNALDSYEKALVIYQKTLPENDPNIATLYNSIGLVYNSRREYSRALTFCKQALDMFEKSLPSIHHLFATSHNNIGLVYTNLKKYSEAIASHQRAVEMGQKTLPANHPDLKVYKQNLESARKAAKK